MTLGSQLSSPLDREVVRPILVRKREGNLLGAERQKVDGVRQFLNNRVAVRTQPGDLRCCGLAVLNCISDEFETGADHILPIPLKLASYASLRVATAGGPPILEVVS